jgi:hypothetical protein
MHHTLHNRVCDAILRIVQFGGLHWNHAGEFRKNGGSMTSIVKKLGLKPGMRALVLGAPSGYVSSFAPVPERVEVSHTLGSAYEFVQFFATKKSDIAKSAKKLLQSATPGALVWITYPKKTSGVDSDLSREAVWAAMEGTGWRPVSQIAIDEVWSALRFRPTQDVSRK